MSTTRSLMKGALLNRIQEFERGLEQDEDIEFCCQWVRTPTSGVCGHKGAVFVSDPPMFHGQRAREVIICHGCIRHFTDGIRKRWRL